MIPALAFSLLVAAAQVPHEPPGWERVYDATGPKDWVTSVLAFRADSWFAGGVGWVARATSGSVERTSTGSRAVLGLAGQKPDDVFALGDDELVMHFDGTRWSEEHVGPKPRRTGRGADILHSVLLEGPRTIAFGPTLALVRADDHTWQTPPAAESKRLLDLTDSGPSHKPLAKCDEAGWFWVARDKALLACQDGRSFMFDSGTFSAKGALPSECRRAFQRVAVGRGELFASCGPGKLWKTEGSRWASFATFPAAKELVSISVTDSCVFVASKRTVWRSCH